MRDEDKPFVLYRAGRWSFRIVPRNGEGWRIMAVWIALSTVPTGLFIWFATRHPEGPVHFAGLGVYLLTLLIWIIASVRWMKARAVEVDVSDPLALKREQDRQRRRR
ncbi:hypothetical protein [Erythrobacter dokdonensis]|uniref:Uncharacterized protein n=1 Tax=Erythrobacter dokdonensis DSW-74 TaxID=1300349 RepID=A0A1A7BFY2_9SPHN|nr:hypothetical protein [Erythrobacter dokdonensis]OBV10317.1 hypothetical protein I603_2279 [Erythrobacter dokdonensis DSW-74]